MLICKQLKRLIDDYKESGLRCGRGSSKPLLRLQINIFTYLRIQGLSWQQIEKIVEFYYIEKGW